LQPSPSQYPPYSRTADASPDAVLFVQESRQRHKEISDEREETKHRRAMMNNSGKDEKTYRK